MAAERGWNQVIGLLQDHGGTEVSRPQETQRGVSPCGPLSKQEYSWPWLRGAVTQTQATSASVVQLRWASLPTGTQMAISLAKALVRWRWCQGQGHVGLWLSPQAVSTPVTKTTVGGSATWMRACLLKWLCSALSSTRVSQSPVWVPRCSHRGTFICEKLSDYCRWAQIWVGDILFHHFLTEFICPSRFSYGIYVLIFLHLSL